MAMAAIIRMKGRLIYPRISPVRAIPSPFKRPMLFLILDSDKCPRIMAGIPAMKERHRAIEAIPRTMLAIAPPSVLAGWYCPRYGCACGGYCACGGTCAGAAGTFSHADVEAGPGVLGC